MAGQPKRPGPKGPAPGSQTELDVTVDQKATRPGRSRGSAETDPLENALDPWAESDAGHPDESSDDTLDQHPEPEETQEKA